MLSRNHQEIDVWKQNRILLLSIDDVFLFIVLSYFFDSAVPAGACRVFLFAKHVLLHRTNLDEVNRTKCASVVKAHPTGETHCRMRFDNACAFGSIHFNSLRPIWLGVIHKASRPHRPTLNRGSTGGQCGQMRSKIVT